jgi:uncharacterized protein YjbJ (UPF0337 family)
VPRVRWEAGWPFVEQFGQGTPIRRSLSRLGTQIAQWKRRPSKTPDGEETAFAHFCSSAQKENVMNWDQVKGNWTQFKGKVKENWGKLTDDELDVIAGEKQQLVGKIQKHYGVTKEQAEKQIETFCGSCSTGSCR